MKLLLTCGGQAGVGASWAEASTAGGMGVAVVWQPGMSKMDHDELQELRGGGEGRAAQVKSRCYAKGLQCQWFRALATKWQT